MDWYGLEQGDYWHNTSTWEVGVEGVSRARYNCQAWPPWGLILVRVTRVAPVLIAGFPLTPGSPPSPLPLQHNQQSQVRRGLSYDQKPLDTSRGKADW